MRFTFRILLLSSLAAGLYSSAIAGPQKLPNGVVKEQIQGAIRALLDNVNKGDLQRGNTTFQFALACLFANRDVGEANRLILDYCRKNPIVREAKIAPHYPTLEFRIYLTPQCRERLTPEVKAVLEERALDWAYYRSRIGEREKSLTNWHGGFHTRMSEWNLAGSENLQAEWLASNFMALAILRSSGAPYGGQVRLGDAHTIEEHYRGWEDYWMRYFSSHAREGLECEVAHPSSYGNGTLRSYYAVADFADSAALKRLATNFLDLHWTSVACEFEPRTGIRSACAATRCYKDTWQQTGSIYWAAPLLLAYGWWKPDTADARHARPSFQLMPYYASSYRPPAILQSIAADMNREPYLGTTRKFGRGSGAASVDRMIVFDDGDAGNSYIRRDVYYTPDYTLSALTFDPARSYIESVRQSRVMGVTFSGHVNARIIVYGSAGSDSKYFEDAEAEHKQVTSATVNGVCGRDVLIVGRDPGAVESDGVRLFVSAGALWDNRSQGRAGWLFTQLGGAYCGIRVAAGGYEIKEAPKKNGVFLQLKDKWAPVLIQMGRKPDHKNIDAFRAAVEAAEFSYAANRLSWVSLAGDRYEFWAKSTHLPRINDAPLNLNPEKTYDTPFLSMQHGSNVATISYPGHEPLVLDFSRP